MSLMGLEQTSGKCFLYSLAYIFYEGHKDLNKNSKNPSEKCILKFEVESC